MKYYAMIDGERRGPYELEQLPAAGVRPTTYVWCKGMADWEEAGDVADICRFFRNHIYDLMHPSNNPSDENQIKNSIDTAGSQKTSGGVITNPRMRDAGGESPLASLDEVAQNEEANQPVAPASIIGLAWIGTILCFPPTGIAALFYAYRCRNASKNGETRNAYDYGRLAKMLTGITFFLGLLVYGFLFRFLS